MAVATEADPQQTLADFAATEGVPPADPPEDAPPAIEETGDEPKDDAESKVTDGLESEDDSTETTETIKDWIKDNLGYNTDVFDTDEEAVKGLQEVIKLSTRRDEDANFGRQLRQALAGRSEEEIAAFLQNPSENSLGKKESADKNAPPPFDPVWEHQITVDAEGNLVPAKGAPSDVVQKYRTYVDWEKQRLREMARNPSAFSADSVKQMREEIANDVMQKMEGVYARQTINQQMAQWESDNLAEVYVNGKDGSGGLTTIGKRIVEIDKQLSEDGIANPLTRLNRAMELARAGQKKTATKTTKLPGKGVRQPAIAPGPPTKRKTDEELYAEGNTLSQVWLIREKEKAAAAGSLE